MFISYASVPRAIKPHVVHWQWIVSSFIPLFKTVSSGEMVSPQGSVWKVKHKNTKCRNICHVILLKGQVAGCWKLHGCETGMNVETQQEQSVHHHTEACSTWGKGEMPEFHSKQEKLRGVDFFLLINQSSFLQSISKNSIPVKHYWLKTINKITISEYDSALKIVILHKNIFLGISRLLSLKWLIIEGYCYNILSVICITIYLRVHELNYKNS